MWYIICGKNWAGLRSQVVDVRSDEGTLTVYNMRLIRLLECII